jgi:hypothetical protein
MSPRWNWDSPTPSLASECAIPPRTKGRGAHSPAGEGLGESQFRRLEKSLALCLLCDLNNLPTVTFLVHWGQSYWVGHVDTVIFDLPSSILIGS